MDFQTLQKEMLELNSKIEELTSAVYRIFAYDNEYAFVCYYDKQAHTMKFAVILNGIECKLLQDVPSDLLVAYGQFIDGVKKWEYGEIQEFPIQYVEDTSEENQEHSPQPIELNEAELR